MTGKEAPASSLFRPCWTTCLQEVQQGFSFASTFSSPWRWLGDGPLASFHSISDTTRPHKRSTLTMSPVD